MKTLHPSILEYRKQLQKGVIQQAYQGLMHFYRDLRTSMEKGHPEANISNIQYGLMDFTYFFYSSKKLASHKLKIAVLFDHSSFCFELWLVGNNKAVQGRYQRLFAELGWKKYSMAETTRGVYHIIRQVLIEKPEFDNLGKLTKQIDRGTAKFAAEIELTLAKV